MRKYFIIIVLLFSINAAFCAIYTPNYHYPNKTFNHYKYYQPQISNTDLSALEKYLTNRTYNRESQIRRIERLENLAFGAIQYGDLETRFKNVEHAILSRPSNKVKRSTIGNIANYFWGQSTGYTPPIINNSTNSYSQIYYPSKEYSSSRYDTFSNGLFGNSYRLYNQSFGNGSSIRILP